MTLKRGSFFMMVLYCLPSLAIADEQFDIGKLSYTYFGLGIERIQYQEEITTASGTINMKTVASNFVQRSGGYTPISRKSGFIINTASTVDSGRSIENWQLSNVGRIQSNEMNLEVTEVNLEGVRSFASGQFFSSGIGINSFRFTRSNFNTSTLIANQPLGSVSETSLNIIANVGYRYDSFFVDPEQKIRLAGLVQLGIPIYYGVDNTGSTQWDRTVAPQTVSNAVRKQAPVSLSNYFPSGYDAKLDGLIGYKINNHFTLASFIELSYKKRASLRRANVMVPKTKTTTFRAIASIVWSF